MEIKNTKLTIGLYLTIFGIIVNVKIPKSFGNLEFAFAVMLSYIVIYIGCYLIAHSFKTKKGVSQ